MYDYAGDKKPGAVTMTVAKRGEFVEKEKLETMFFQSLRMSGI